MDSATASLVLLPNDRQSAIRLKLKRNLATLKEYYSSNRLPVNGGIVIGGSTCSILHYLAAHGHLAELELFCCELTRTQPGDLLRQVNIQSSDRKSPLHLAISNNQLACIKVLIKYGGNIWQQARVENGFRQYMNAIDLAHVSGNFQVESYLRKVEKEQEASILHARRKLAFLCAWERGRFAALPKTIIRVAVGFF